MKKALFILMACIQSVMLSAEVRVLSVPGFDWHEPTAWLPMGVPTAEDTVEIHGYTFIKADSTARAKHVLIGINGELDIKRNQVLNLRGVLVVENSEDIGILNEGIIDNGGRITVRHTLGYGIQNNGSLRNKEGAKIHIIDSECVGLYNFNDFKNHGVIEINQINLSYGIRSNTGFTNQLTGHIIIKNSQSTGIGIHLNTSTDTLLNDGQIGIYNNMQGIWNNGTIINNNEIIIDSISSGEGIMNNYNWINNENSTLEISNIFESGSHGISIGSQARLLNYGDVRIQDSQGSEGIENSGHLLNYDTIHIRRMGSYGLSNQGLIDNYGYLKVSQTSDHGIENTDTLLNHDSGKIRILNLDSLFIAAIHNNDGFLKNEGEINIDNIPKGYGIYNTGEFINQSYTYIDQAELIGFWNEGNCILNYNSLMDISSIDNFDSTYGFENDSSLTVYGTLRIDHAEYGLYNTQTTNNYGLIDVEDCSTNGVANHTLLINHPAGFIDTEVPSTQNAIGLYNGFFTNLQNAGTIRIWNERTAEISNVSSTTKSTSTNNLTGILNHGIMSNDSLIVIEAMETGFRIDDTFAIEECDNQGTIAILESSIIGLSIKGTLLNQEEGQILLGNSSNIPLEIILGSTFDCFGILDTDSNYSPPFSEN